MKSRNNVIDKIPYDKDVFLSQYLQKNIPVVLTGAIQSWPALNKWNLEYFFKMLGDIKIRYRSSQSKYHPNMYGENTTLVDTSMEKFLSLFKAGNDAKLTYFLSGEFTWLYHAGQWNRNFENINSDINIPDFIPLEQIERIGFWLSPQHVISWLHYDGNGAHNFNAQILGIKKVCLISPHEASCCYLHPYDEPDNFNFSRVDIEAINLNLYPDFKNVTRHEQTLNPGDVLYIPPFWLHSFEHIDTCNLNINFWWHNQHVQVNPLAIRNHCLYQLRNIFGKNTDLMLSRSEFIHQLNSMNSDIKTLIDRLDRALININ